MEHHVTKRPYKPLISVIRYAYIIIMIIIIIHIIIAIIIATIFVSVSHSTTTTGDSPKWNAHKRALPTTPVPDHPDL